MIAAGLTLLAFFALAGAMPRHAPILLGRWAPKIRPGMLRALGWVLLLAALAATLWARDWPIALVRWFGLLPLALESGQAGREVQGPMAVVILGGLVSSLVLTLLLLPALMWRWRRR